MGKRIGLLALALLLICLPALGEMNVERQEGEAYFPDEKNWVYHFTYAYPFVVGEDYTSALINDTYEMARDEWVQLVLPMFANSEDMYFDGKNEVTHDFSVVCNNGLLLSILERRTQTMGEEGVKYALEALTFDVSGLYAGETLTLRGVTLIQAGVDPQLIEDVEAEDFPAMERVILGSSTQMGQAVLPILYEEFKALQLSGVGKADVTQADFEIEFSPTRDFYADEEGRVVFFLPPALLSEPTFDVPLFPFTPQELEQLLAQ